jgi:hypothetical protein
MAKMEKKDERVSSVLQRQLLSFRASAREEEAHGERRRRANDATRREGKGAVSERDTQPTPN